MKPSTRAIRTAIGVAAVVAVAAAPDAAAGGRRADDWKNVAGLQPGTIVTVTALGAAPLRCLAAFADPRGLTVVRFIQTQSPERVQRALQALSAAALTGLPATSIRAEGISFSHGAVLDGAIKVAEVVAIPKDDVVEVEVMGTARHGSTTGAVIGAAAGGVAALLIAPHFLLRQCGGSCTDEAVLMYSTAIGLPVGGGLLGYYAGRGTDTRVIYRAPAVQPLVLDEATWQRVRAALPPSLRGDGASESKARARLIRSVRSAG